MWLADPGGIPEGFRPDKVKAIIVISNDGATPAVFCDRPPAGDFRHWLDMHSYTRRILLMNSRGMATALIVNGQESEVETERVDINTMRWNLKGEKKGSH
jgi:hypothetical protein